MADVEEVVQGVSNTREADRMRARLVNVLQNEIRRPKALSHQERLMETWERETIEFLKRKGKEIVIINSDKGNKTTIMNRVQYEEKMEALNLPEGVVLVSLDVVSLFTYVPIELALQEVDRRFHEIEDHTTLEKEELARLVSFCLTSGYFLYKGGSYVQLDGVAMGSPISPIVADIVMQRALECILNSSSLRISFIKKYVDDLLVAIHSEDVQNVLEVFNGFHPKIKFTLEEEVENKLPYLDMVLHRNQDGSIKTVWYSKPCSSQRMLNYHSLHPINMLLNVARNFRNRVRKLTSKEDENPDEIIRRVLRRNAYPEHIIRSLLRPERQHRRAGGTDEGERQDEPAEFHSMVYVKGLSERLRNIIKKSGNKKTAFKPAKRVKSFFTKVKDPIPQEQKSDVVYEIPCGGCELRYIGTTGQHLKNRIQQHRRDCRPPISNEQPHGLEDSLIQFIHTYHPYTGGNLIQWGFHAPSNSSIRTIHTQVGISSSGAFTRHPIHPYVPSIHRWESHPVGLSRAIQFIHTYHPYTGGNLIQWGFHAPSNSSIRTIHTQVSFSIVSPAEPQRQATLL
ncbi:uncharacterized protein LOC129809198 [Phlebotomus papatasi]|uniref:uncharacterized protein LOC129809198 n=1 Tax=Phlebotomus papatasi TaxID=29031 RepID=UPI0024842049|nr:uncharacterized protein LOC129809198 [Phlebotomus papatasi]